MNELDERSSAELKRATDTAGVFGLAKKLDRVTWLTWWAGTALIVLSWISVVSNSIGWIGFGIAMASTIISVIARRYWRIPD
jgi:hypothetical protein